MLLYVNVLYGIAVRAVLDGRINASGMHESYDPAVYELLREELRKEEMGIVEWALSQVCEYVLYICCVESLLIESMVSVSRVRACYGDIVETRCVALFFDPI